MIVEGFYCNQCFKHISTEGLCRSCSEKPKQELRPTIFPIEPEIEKEIDPFADKDLTLSELASFVLGRGPRRYRRAWSIF
jgi:hypothetical protein